METRKLKGLKRTETKICVIIKSDCKTNGDSKDYTLKKFLKINFELR